MTIFEINDTDAICDTAQVRQACGNPSNHPWLRYRQIVGIESHARRLTLKQAFLLWVCANLYKKGERKVTLARVYEVANKCLASEYEKFEQLKVLLGTEPIEGSRILEVIEYCHGKAPTMRTVYRKVKGFSTNKRYTAEQVRKILKKVS